METGFISPRELLHTWPPLEVAKAPHCNPTDPSHSLSPICCCAGDSCLGYENKLKPERYQQARDHATP